MQSILITGGNLASRQQKALQVTSYKLQVTRIDTLIIQGENSIGIDQIRELEKWASRKPFASKSKAAIIFEAEKLTTEAQNALLKTLEEPPKNTLIILTAPNKDLLLPTIISRCKIINLKKKAEIKLDDSTAKDLLSVICYLLSAKAGQRLKKAQKIAKTREEAITFLNQLIFLLRQLLLQKYQISPIFDIPDSPDRVQPKLSATADIPDLPNLIRQAQKSKQMLKKNVHLKLALDNFLLDFPSLE